MKIENQTSLKIKLKGNDIDNFKSIINKTKEEQKLVGFKTTKFTDDEVKLIEKISEKL